MSSIQPHNRLQSCDLDISAQSKKNDDVERQPLQQNAEPKVSQVFQSIFHALVPAEGSPSETKNEVPRDLDLLCDEEDVLTSIAQPRSSLGQECNMKTYVNSDSRIEANHIPLPITHVKKTFTPRYSLIYLLSEKEKAKLVWFVKECGVENIEKFKSCFRSIKMHSAADSLKKCYMHLENEGNLDHYLHQASANKMLTLLTEARKRKIANGSLDGGIESPAPYRRNTSEKEKKVLVSLVEVYGRKWTKFLPFFPGYNASALRDKYSRLQKVSEILKSTKDDQVIIDECRDIAEAVGFDGEAIDKRFQALREDEEVIDKGFQALREADEKEFDGVIQSRSEVAIPIDVPEVDETSAIGESFYF